MLNPGDGFLQVLIILAINFFVLQGFDKRLTLGIVIDIATPAHTDLYPMLLEQLGVIARSVLHSSVGMVH